MNGLTLHLPDELLDEIARRAAALVDPRPVVAPESPFLTTAEAAELLRCSRQRIHDLLSQGKLTRLKEGRRTLLLRSEVEALVQVERERRSR